jgi:type VI protein secretion system component VasF
MDLRDQLNQWLTVEANLLAFLQRIRNPVERSAARRHLERVRSKIHSLRRAIADAEAA